MPKKYKIKLDKLLFKEKLESYLVWFFVALIVTLLSVYMTGLSPTNSKQLTGIVLNSKASLHREGHTLYLLVKIPELSYPVKVLLPKNEPIKVGVQIEIREHTPLWFGKAKYSFFKYKG